MDYTTKYNLKKLISNSFGKFFNPKGKRILMYHSLGTKVKNDVYNIYSVDVNLFKSQMNFLKDNYSQNLCLSERAYPLSQERYASFPVQ